MIGGGLLFCQTRCDVFLVLSGNTDAADLKRGIGSEDREESLDVDKHLIELEFSL